MTKAGQGLKKAGEAARKALSNDSRWNPLNYRLDASSQNLPLFGVPRFTYRPPAAKVPLGLPAPKPTFGNSLGDVSKSLFKSGSLPDNFITKAQAEALGWNPKAGNLGSVAPGKSIGGDIFRNDKNLLPSAPGRIWFEADLNYSGGYRGTERLLYSNDGQIFYSADHYRSFQQIGGR
jgi:hypothetical protein